MSASRAARPPRRRRVEVAVGQSQAAGFASSLRFSGFAFLVLGMIVLAALVLAPNIKAYIEQQQEIADLEARLTASQQELEQLDEQIDRWADPAYMRSQIRERLKFVLPGEVLVRVTGIPETVLPADETPISDEVVETDSDWGGALIASTLIAGVGTVSADDTAPADGADQEDTQ